MPISVCTLVRDRNEMLARLVDGLERSRVPPRELVVVRAGGEDPRPALRAATRFRTVVEELPDTGERIAYSIARNRAAMRSTGRFVCFMDADMIPGVDLVGSFVAALEADDAVCFGDLVYLDPEPVAPGWTEAGLRRRGRLHPGRPVAPSQGVARSPAYEFVWGSCFAMRRARFLELGGFDESFLGYAGEDTDLAFRCRDAGVPLLVVGQAAAYHQHHDVYEPPVQQFRATLDNARRFRENHGWWPMGGWLEEFRRMGLVAWDGDHVEVLRDPTDAEIAGARMTSAAPFRAGGGTASTDA